MLYARPPLFLLLFHDYCLLKSSNIIGRFDNNNNKKEIENACDSDWNILISKVTAADTGTRVVCMHILFGMEGTVFARHLTLNMRPKGFKVFPFESW